MKPMSEWNPNHDHLIYLISCALRQDKAEEAMLKGIDLNGVYQLARKHSVTAMVCMALEKTQLFAKANEAIRKQWLDAKNQALWKSVLMDSEREALSDAMEQAKIWHMPLKGSILKDQYPQFGMREMADNDILFDHTKREELKALFLERGYSAEVYNKSNHDVYKKLPVYHFEMHVCLFSKSVSAQWSEKYETIKERLLPDQNRQYRFHFSKEDYFIYLIAHAYKHFSHSGTGIRTLADFYVMLHTIGSSLDGDYVHNELKELGILDYAKDSCNLAEKLFGCDELISDIDLSPKERCMLMSYLGNGTYGTIENRVRNTLASLQGNTAAITWTTKCKYLMIRLFPGRKLCEDSYPVIYRHPALLPAFWVWRWIKRLAVNGKGIRKELSAWKSM